MCWNASVSLKTWYFAVFGFIIGLIGKQLPLSILLFSLLFSSMQLVEYYLWTYLNAEDKNNFYSKVGYLVIALEPLFALFIAHSYKLFSIDITKFLIIFLLDVYNLFFDLDLLEFESFNKSLNLFIRFSEYFSLFFYKFS